MTRRGWPLLAIMMFGVPVRAAAAQNSSLEHECATRRAMGSQEMTGAARFIAQPGDPHFAARSATFTRHLSCGFRAARLLRARETFYLTLLSQDRENPGFPPPAPGMSQRFYLVCEGRVGTTLPTFARGQELTFANNTFTLPCGHMIYPTGSSDPARVERVSGVYAYRVRSAVWKVRRGPTAARPTFDVDLDVVVFNPIEEIHPRGRVLGSVSTSVMIVDCSERRFTKQEENPACR